ncbi:cold shock domain-containing protein [Dysgonomonas massiliensis]|uniref:cold shock domain-containing protein n=1 Tax=Dysgonomonas massiliensis TaxID=2040292 RepID=UPI000C75666A|nr:cold shock domain-containing protein [Dysgonomonas massiliensis]
MAKSNSFNKREVEKRKQEKRKEKQQRKEERKNNPTNSFEDMIAYVDENGMIIDTPPEAREETIDVEDIEISVPKKAETEEIVDFSGRVEFFDETKGFGFIKDRNSVNKYFFHKSNAEEGIKENNIVSFKLERGSKGMNAVDVKITK